MKNLLTTDKKKAIKKGLAKATSFVAGDMHLAFKSMADGVARAEAWAVHKLTDVPMDDVIEDRHNATEKTQEEFKAALKALASGFNTYEYELTNETNS